MAVVSTVFLIRSDNYLIMYLCDYDAVFRAQRFLLGFQSIDRVKWKRLIIEVWRCFSLYSKRRFVLSLVLMSNVDYFENCRCAVFMRSTLVHELPGWDLRLWNRDTNVYSTEWEGFRDIDTFFGKHSRTSDSPVSPSEPRHSVSSRISSRTSSRTTRFCSRSLSSVSSKVWTMGMVA